MGVRPGGANGVRLNSPVIVLTYSHAGGSLLQSLLSERSGLACTSGTGLLPLCQQAWFTWERSEGRGGPPSALALASIRALAQSLITTLLADAGQPRWCEIATAPPAYAETFLRICPDARFVCLHRNCADVMRSAMRANPWGLSDPEFGPFAAAYPGRTAAALAEFWLAAARPLLRFEAAHADSCRRVRYEDIAAGPDQVADELRGYLGLGPDIPAVPRPAWGSLPEGSLPESGESFPAVAPIPLEQIPQPVLHQVSQLLEELSYPPLQGHS